MTDTALPSYSSEEFQRFAPLWAKVDVCLGGTEALRAAGSRGAGGVTESPYLPQFPLEHDESYAYRLETSTFLPAYGDALDMITGAITRKPPSLGKNVPPAIADDWENIDKTGTHWTVFAQRALQTGVHHGATYALVDMPQRPEGEFDAAQAAAMDFRPFALLYSAKELANWPRYVVIDGAPILQQIVFCEASVVVDGFGESCTERYRVWRLPVEQDAAGNYHRAGNAEWEIWEERETASKRGKKTKTIVVVDSGVSPLVDIPVAVFNANPCLTNPRETDGPVLLDLANVNLKHYQITSDHEKILHKCTPVLTTAGLREENGAIEVAGLDYRLDCESGGSASFIEPPGTSLTERREWIAGIEKQLLEMGAGMFAEGSDKGQMTATEVRERGGAKQSRVSQIAESWKDFLETIAGFFAQWKKLESGGEITLGVSAADLVLSPNELATISQMVERGQHSLETLWAVEKKLGILQDDFNSEKELAQIAKEKEMFAPNIGEQVGRMFNAGAAE